MAIYKNITTAAIQNPLIDLDVSRVESVVGTSGKINTVRLCNTNTTHEVNVKLYYEDASANKFYLFANKIPPVVSLLLDNVSFDSRTYKLMIDTTGSTSTALTVIIK
tara:strand:- start:321 stop:641 length:321 start_codon:yes stop_codon:yes gene_type:complete